MSVAKQGVINVVCPNCKAVFQQPVVHVEPVQTSTTVTQNPDGTVQRTSNEVVY